MLPRDNPAEFLKLLYALLPDADRTLLMQACLLPENEGREAWKAWRSDKRDLKTTFEKDATGLKGLLPLLHENLSQENGILDGSTQTYLRTARFREELRSTAYRSVCRTVFEGLAEREIPFVATRACALADTIYASPEIRHCHGIDLLVSDNDLKSATATLTGLGFTRSSARDPSEAVCVELHHETGMPLVLWVQLFALPYYHAPMAKIWSRAEMRTIADRYVQVLSPADSLLLVIGSAACRRDRSNLRWISDAWHLIEREAMLDWQCFCDVAHYYHISLPVYVILDFLHREFAVKVPDSVLNSLRLEAIGTDGLGREAALLEAIEGANTAIRTFREFADSWELRIVLAKFLLKPSKTCLRWRYPSVPDWIMPALYLYRPVDYFISRSYRHLSDSKLLRSSGRP